MQKLSLLTLFIFITFFSLAQTGTFRGFVYEAESGEPALFINLKLDNTDFVATTDVNGYFSFAKVPAGKYTLRVFGTGYAPITKEIEIISNKVRSDRFFLKPNRAVLKQVEVSAEKEEAQTNVRTSVISATARDIKAVPTIGGEADVATYFQVVPGVVSTGDQGGQLYVRGGSPVQNKVLLDGMTIFNPFHSIGFFSVFDTEIIRNADIYTGGYGAKYGGRISAIMDITTIDGNANETEGKVSVNTFGAKAIVQGPLKKREEGSAGSTTYVLSAKTSYLDKTSTSLYDYANDEGELPYSYTDLYGKLTFKGDKGSKFSLFGFNYNDKAGFRSNSEIEWDALGFGTDFLLVPGSSTGIVKGKFSYSDYEITLDEDGLSPRTSSVNNFQLGFDFKNYIKSSEMNYGIEVSGFSTDFNYFNANNRLLEQKDNTTELAVYYNYRINTKRWVIDPGVRIHYYATLSDISIEPRIGTKYNWNENFRLKAAFGVYSQNLISATSDRDVVNLFYGFLSGPENLPDEVPVSEGETRERNHRLQKANHYIVGGEYDITNRITVNLEFYYKDFTQLSNLNRNKLFDDNADNRDIEDVLKKDYIIETGDAYGIDFTLKYVKDKTYFWFVYSLGKVTRYDGLREYAPIFDRRHNINIVLTRVFGKKDQWEVNTRWNFGSGLPFTQNLGVFHKIDFQEGIGTDITSDNADELTVLYAGLNESRLPTYHRLDLTLTRRIQFEKSKLEIYGGITNIYDRDNIFFIDRLENKAVYQLPILPSIGASLSF